MRTRAHSLTEADLSNLASESWIDSATAEVWDLHRVSSVDGAELIGRNDRADYSGIVFPVYWPGDSGPKENFLRRDHPDFESHNGRLKPRQKYLAPPGRGNRLLFGPGESAEALTNSSVPVVLVEGLKKTMAAWRLARWESEASRFLACGLTGVWNFRGTIGKTTDATGTRVSIKGIIADFDRVHWDGRDVFVLYDSDSASNPSVRAARDALANALRTRGARVIVMFLPAIDGLAKTGFDDLVACWGPQAVLAWLQQGQTGTEEVAPHITPSADAAHLHTPPALAQDPHILMQFEYAVRQCGVVGEERGAKLIFLAVTSRLLMDPVSLAIKGLSSSGKSFMTETTLKFFPESAYISMTAMSERALVYMKEDFKHKTLVIFEAVALREQREKNESNLTAYFVRSLLSEGRISYPVAVHDNHDGWVTKTIIKEGPTNVILTTTATELHGENETRLLSLPTNDSRDQTKAVMLRLAEGRPREVNFQEWHELQDWLMTAEHRVVIPYATFLAETIPPVAVRLRRDFKAILRLIEAHAVLHQCTRDRDDEGRIVATSADYCAVRELVADLVANGVGATVPDTMRATVQAVQQHDLGEGATVRQVAHELKLDRSATQRRLQAARERGYLVNLEEKRGRPARYALGDALPDDQELLPRDVPETGCAHSTEGVQSPAHTLNASDPEPIGGGVHLCSNSREKYSDDGGEAEEVTLDDR